MAELRISAESRVPKKTPSSMDTQTLFIIGLIVVIGIFILIFGSSDQDVEAEIDFDEEEDFGEEEFGEEGFGEEEEF